MRPNGNHIRHIIEGNYRLRVDKVTVREYEDLYTCVIVINPRDNKGADIVKYRMVSGFIQTILEEEYGKVFALVNMHLR